jgi:hypothetical protein
MDDAGMIRIGHVSLAQVLSMAGLLLVLQGCGADGDRDETAVGVDAGQDPAGADPYWSPISDAAWLEPRVEHTALWTGTEMIIWGGVSGVIEIDPDFGGDDPSFGDGGRYDPSTESWQPVSEQGAPSPRAAHSAIWTGEEMIVWGGIAYDGEWKTFHDGGRYDPVTDSWRPISLVGAPAARYRHVAVWTGSKMIVWGGLAPGESGRDGGVYDPATDSWYLLEEFGVPPEVHSSHVAFWTGDRLLLVATSYSGSVPFAVAFFDPSRGSLGWSLASMIGAPNVEDEQVVWTGDELIVWGQRSGMAASTGGRYDAVTDSWTPMSKAGSPTYRSGSTMVWAESRALVWGGIGWPSTGDEVTFKTGGAYDPLTDAWDEIPRPFDEAGREAHTAVWTGSEMIAWGGRRTRGQIGQELLKSGIRYRPQ